ncbi:MAG: dolichol kinase [Crenarchaeota archaeon]|nr:dolichol kinase [Thermoproteota archaeon]
MLLTILPKNITLESIEAIILFLYVIGILYVTKILYNIMRKRGLPHNVAVYYNRKFIHVFAGGVIALLTPILFTSPLIPLILAAVLAVFCYIPHKRGKLLYWFQVEDNMYEVNFCIMWGITIFVLWILFNNPWLAIVPVAFMAFGDAATGVVRNTLFKRRTKHWIGNIAMFATCAPLGLYYAGLPGLVAAAVASLIERFEFNPIDDNVLICISATVILYIMYVLLHI